MKTELKIEIVPFRLDNYAYLLRDTLTEQTAVFDCGDSVPVKKVLRQNNWSVTHIFATHAHSDHTAGISDLMSYYPNARLYIAAGEKRLRGATHRLSDGDQVNFGNRSIKAIRVTAHTKYCMAYLISSCLFTGDALFSGGCGRIFEGSAEDLMMAMDIFCALPEDTDVFVGHEYTEANLKFALTIERDNPDLKQYASQVKNLRNAGKFTVPTTIGLEKKINPFLRVDLPSVRQSIDPKQEFGRARRIAVLRQLKDNF